MSISHFLSESAKRLFKEPGVLSNSHPYYPLDLNLPEYQPLVIPFDQILGAFFGTAGLLLIVVWALSGKGKHLTIGERLVLTWFVLTGIIHLVVEGAVVLRSDFYKSTSGNILFEIWKEYAKADSRYATRDSFVISMEAFTAFVEGPLCFVIVYGIVKQKPWRYTLQLLVSFGQIYGDVLYFATTYLEGLKHSRPEWLYFWFYFVIVNSIWIVIPAAVVAISAWQISKAIAVADR
ncbi:Emopamil-binding protein [Coccomyxa subellipsoidea C-169]|uniref:Emopamil-binding protein n=1 Tax=Coccomyxa subellipsoidea (strain C-169) TaxID=574566 RepID=I0Z3P7_COCSC|nr:Emopamil-binding protein [Coccomyxa subellipsoidea C-169]EIE25266.1 Emopamil-binding protein [Coccomyxa subellipsoidea C-169]|eukprot:XP_005649810.1 Emopamil-binding protein [Coccomyxa subellipsoidea C-169]